MPKKAFQFAHTLDPKNIQVIIDLSELQIQVRDFAGYRTSKQKLINERGGNHAYWLGFMTGAYLDAKYDLCRDIISTFRDTLEDKPSYMRQELVFLETQCFMVEKKWREAIGVLEKGMKDVLNVDKAKEMLAVLYGYVGEKEKSEALWKELLDICEENYLYYRGLECCVLDLWNTFELLQGNGITLRDRNCWRISGYLFVLSIVICRQNILVVMRCRLSNSLSWRERSSRSS